MRIPPFDHALLAPQVKTPVSEWFHFHLAEKYSIATVIMILDITSCNKHDDVYFPDDGGDQVRFSKV